MLTMKSFVAAAALTFGLVAYAHAETPAGKPSGNVEFIVGAGAGGENDRIARAIQRALQENGLVSSMTVLNKPGAGQVIAMTDLSQRKGNTKTIGLASGSFINAIARSGSDLYKRITPVVKLFDAYQCFFTKADSPIKSMTDVHDYLAKDPTSVTFGFPVGLGSPLHVAAVQVADTAGVPAENVKAVVFDSGSDVAAEVAGGHVDVGITSIGSALPLIESGQLRFLGIAAPKRMGGGLKDVPTLIEQGVNVVVTNTFTVVAPPGLKDEQLQFWNKAMDTVLADKNFQAELDKNYWVATPVKYPEAVSQFEKEYNENRAILKRIGFAE